MRLIDADALILALDERYNQKSGIVPDNLAEGFVQVKKLIKEQPTAFDADKINQRLEELTIEELGIDKAKFSMDKGEYSSYCSLSLHDVKEVIKAGLNQ